jgi:hypothetical protein
MPDTYATTYATYADTYADTLITHTFIGLFALNSKLVTLKQSSLRTTATKLWIANFQLTRPSN